MKDCLMRKEMVYGVLLRKPEKLIVYVGILNNGIMKIYKSIVGSHKINLMLLPTEMSTYNLKYQKDLIISSSLVC